jgi:hypothetical protein
MNGQYGYAQLERITRVAPPHDAPTRYAHHA